MSLNCFYEPLCTIFEVADEKKIIHLILRNDSWSLIVYGRLNSALITNPNHVEVTINHAPIQIDFFSLEMVAVHK